MYVYLHVILSFIFALILYPFIGINSGIVFLSGFLFDVDHYIYYVLKKKDFSLKHAYLYCIPGSRFFEKHRDVLHISHTIEFWIVLLLLSWFLDGIFLFVFIGLIFHMLLDGIHLRLNGEGFGARTWSLIGWLGRH